MNEVLKACFQYVACYIFAVQHFGRPCAFFKVLYKEIMVLNGNCNRTFEFSKDQIRYEVT